MSELPEKLEGICEVCQKIGKRKCSSCMLVFYCCLEHQQAHWKSHKDVCNPFEINHSGLLGRYLKATRELKPGDVVFSESPLIIGPKIHRFENEPFPCVGCCRLLYDQTCERCPGCFWPICRLDCEGLKSPDYHGLECNILKLRKPAEAKPFFDYYRFDILIILRALYLQKYNLKKWKLLMDLEDHLSYRGPTSNIYKTIEEKVQVLEDNYLQPLRIYEKEINQVILTDTSANLIHSIYGILDVNAVQLTEETDALVLYHIASLLEHNCVPNTMQIIEKKDNFKITLRAASKIREDNHITSSYTNILWGTRVRRDHLKRTKYFICGCQRCRDPSEFGTMFSALRCIGNEKEPCGGLQLPMQPTAEFTLWQCDRCKIELPDEEVMKFVNHLRLEVDKVMDKQSNITELEDILNKLRIFLHSNHYLNYNIKHTLVQLYENQSELEMPEDVLNKKLKMVEELIDLTRKIDPGNARLSLYMAVLLNDQFITKFKLASRVIEDKRNNMFVGQVRELSKILEDNKKIIQYERNTASGSDLYDVIVQNELMLKNWINQNNFG